MPLDLIDPNGSNQAYGNGWEPPIDPTGLALAHFFGNTLAISAKNYAAGGVATTVVGAPTVDAYDINLLEEVNYLQTGMTDTDGLTVLMAINPLAGVSANLIGNQSSASQGVTGGQINGFNLSITYNAGFGGSGLAPTLVRDFGNGGSPTYKQCQDTGGLLTAGTPYFLAAQYVSSENKLRLQNLTTGRATVVNGPASPLPILAQPPRIGSKYGTVSGAGSKLYTAHGWNRNLSSTEINTMYAFIKGYLSRRGITI